MVSRHLLKIIAACVVIGLALAGANHFAASIPMTPQWWSKRHAAEAARLRGEVDGLKAAAAGQAEIAAATETHHTREVIYRDVTSQAVAEARITPDADTPLEAGLAAVLGGHDRSLCDSGAPCSPAPDASSSGQGAL